MIPGRRRQCHTCRELQPLAPEFPETNIQLFFYPQTALRGCAMHNFPYPYPMPFILRTCGAYNYVQHYM